MKRLFLVRHGPTHAKGMIGWTDLPADLSDTAALSRLSEWLPAGASIVSSDLQRCIATADALAAGKERLPHDANLREMHFGDWEQLTWAEVSSAAPDHIRAFYEQPGDIAPPRGESWHDLAARVHPAIDRLLAERDEVIVVCHYGVVLSQLQRATGLTAYETFSQKVDNLSATEILIEGGTWRAGAINHCP